MFRIKNILRRSAALIIIVLILICNDLFGAVRIIEADQVRPRIRLCSGPIISGSDSLIADGVPLQRDSDYTIDYMEGTLTLSGGDLQFQKLEIHYTPLPSWLKRHYGIRPGVADRPLPPSRPMAGEAAAPVRTGRAESMSIRGAKKFSITSQSGGTSQFNQELELIVRGEISPGLQVSGSVADRGYDPSYGTINSSISELDKLNLKISSSTFYSEIGHLEYGQYSGYGSSQIKQVSGIKAAYSGKRYDFSALFGRPRGKFKTARFRGQDRVQGPYRILADNTVEAIVPGS